MKNEQQVTNGNGLPPLGLQTIADQPTNQIKSTTPLKKNSKRQRRNGHIGLLVGGGLLLVGVVLVGGYWLLKQKPRVAIEKLPPKCSSLKTEEACKSAGAACQVQTEKVLSPCSEQDCDKEVDSCRYIETKTVYLCEKCDDNGQNCALISKATTKTDCKNKGGSWKEYSKGKVCVGNTWKTKFVACKNSYQKPNKPNESSSKAASNNYGFDFCVGTSDKACQGKNTGDDCLDGKGTCEALKVVNKHDNAPDDAVCSCHSKTCSGGVSHGCGVPPDHIPNYKKTAQIGPFKKDGKLVLFFYPLDVRGGGSGVLKAIINYNGKAYEIKMGKAGKQRIVTNIEVRAGSTATLTEVVEHDQHDSCAPKQGNPAHGIGWIPVNSDQTCGSGLPGPPQNGACTPFKKLSIKEAVSWAKNFGQPILSKECWADWMEWPGDYDFNDYFIMFSVEPLGVSCQSLTKDKTSIQVGDKVKLTCQASASGGKDLNYEFRYSINDGEWQKISAKSNVTYLSANKSGQYVVQCRACLPTTNICSNNWLPAKAK